MPPPIPAATYRLQFNAAFTFDAAAGIADYLDALGISHVYASSYLCAVPGSTHGYDVTDPTRLNPEIGDEASYRRFVASLRRRGMGHIIDLVPNHMGIAQSANPWWQDVLENGPSSRYAPIFDIDWHPLKPELENKVLLPILGDSYGAVLERQEIRLEYGQGAFRARYFTHTLPVAPGTYGHVLDTEAAALIEEIGAESDAGIEFLSIMSAIRRLPGRDVQDAELRAERAREKEVIKRRLAALTAASPPVLAHIGRAVDAFNGRKGDPRSFDQLDALLSAQAYRLAYWRVAGEEINYRRFFDINELAAIRMEDPEVFAQAHELITKLVHDGAVTGLRIDHPDGLYAPAEYFGRLQELAVHAVGRPFYIVAEKILSSDERLPDTWAVAGTTGYEFLNLLNGIFVDRKAAADMERTYTRLLRERAVFTDLVYDGKRQVMEMSMASELNVLGHRLNRISEKHRSSRDFTLRSLTRVLREIIASFPVYRTYFGESGDVTADVERLDRAVEVAKRRTPALAASMYDWTRALLRLEHPAWASEAD